MKIGVGVAGGTGYSGQELLKILKHHPGFEVRQMIGRETDWQDWDAKLDLVFLCTPHELSHEWAVRLLNRGVSVVDLSGAYRLKNHSYKEWYGFEHEHGDFLQRAEYGLYPYLKPRPRGQAEAPRLIANPGCFATAALPALIPLIKSEQVNLDSISIDAKSGTSGAGRRTELHLTFSERFGGLLPYRLGRHQHWPEIVEAVQIFAGHSISPAFVTELLPVERGISVCIFSHWREMLGTEEKKLQKLLEVYQNFYSPDDGISVGTEPSLFEMKSVVGRHVVHIGLAETYGHPVIFCSLDNLLRGAAAQAVMNANQWAGFPTFLGLDFWS